MTTSSHKLLALMFTDIEGYSALMGQDEARALQTLEKNREVQQRFIEQFGGKLLKDMGDGTLVSFETTTEAVKCAIEIQRECIANDIKLRIGINLGEVAISDNDILGDGVNIASRIEKLGQPGAILVSKSVRDEVVNKGIDAIELPQVQLKNISRSVSIYAIKADGITIPDAATISKKKGNSRKWAIPAAVVAFLAIAITAYFFYFARQVDASGSGNSLLENKSIAVLYFDNLSADEDQEYFSDGLTEEIISRLAKIEGLRVISKTSMKVYKGQPINLKKIARELGVSAVLEGSVRKAGNTLRITASLINADTDEDFWSDTFDRELKQTFAIQSEIAQKIAEKFEITLTPEMKLEVSKITTGNMEAYDYFLRAKHLLTTTYTANPSSDSASYGNAIMLFGKAIELDPSFGLAYAGLADIYDAILTNENYDTEDGQRYDSMRQSLIKKAYELDPNSAYVNNVMIWVLMNRPEPVWDSGFYHARKAYLADPNDYYNAKSLADVYRSYGLNLNSIALPFLEKAINLNPLDQRTLIALGVVYHDTGQNDKADKAFESAIALAATDSYFNIGFVIGHLILTRQLDRAEQMLSKLDTSTCRPQRTWLSILRGNKEAISEIDHYNNVWKAILFADAGKTSEAIEVLKNIQGGFNAYDLIQHEPFIKLKGEPGFDEVLDKFEKLNDEYTERYKKYAEGLLD